MSRVSAHRADVIIIGAGPAGLATAACLSRAGIRYTMLDQGTAVGASWRRHYRRLHLHTVKGQSALPYLPFPQAVPRYPSRQMVIDYLDHYAAHFDIRPRFGVTVHSATQVDASWHLETSAGRWRSHALVMATGFNRVPSVPCFRGSDAFRGPIIHSSAYQDGQAFAGQDVLVVGSGNSGAEIAVDLYEHGAHPTLVVRSPVHTAARSFLGLQAQESAIRLAQLPEATANALMRAASWLSFGDLSSYGLVRPKMGAMTQIKTRGRVPIIDTGLIALVKAGKIQVLPGIDHFDAKTVHCVGGQTQAIDAVVLATGYKTGLRHLLAEPELYLNETGQPLAHGEEVGNANLYLLGFANPPTGTLREIALEAPKIATAIQRSLQSADLATKQPLPVSWSPEVNCTSGGTGPVDHDPLTQAGGFP